MIELDYIKQEALSLDVGDTGKAFCPFCDNEEPYAPSMSITRTDAGILYNCYRAICSGHGFIGSLPSDLIKISKKKNKTFTPKRFHRPTRILTDAMMYKLGDKYSISREELNANGIRQIIGRYGLLMPLYAINGYSFGNTTKYFSGDKAIHYLETDTSKITFTQPRRKSDTIILTEDVLSAIRVHRFAQGAALLGTNLTSDMVMDIIKLGYKHLIIALDPDATKKAEKMRREFGLFFTTCKVVYLSNDPKDVSHNQLQEELGL